MNILETLLTTVIAHNFIRKHELSTGVSVQISWTLTAQYNNN